MDSVKITTADEDGIRGPSRVSGARNAVPSARRFSWPVVARETAQSSGGVVSAKPSPSADAAADVNDGINVISYVSGNLGVGVTARNFVRALLDSQYALAICDVDPGWGRGRADLTYEHLFVPSVHDLPYATTLLILPPGAICQFIAAYPHLTGDGHTCAGLTMWELPVLPAAWQTGLARLDAVIGESDFVSGALSNSLSGSHVMTARHPLYLPATVRADRARYGLPRNGVIFYTVFEPLSDLARKNPFAVIEAFAHVAARSSNTYLLLKVNNPRVDGIEHPLVTTLKNAVASVPRVILDEHCYRYEDVLGLYASCDVFVSLHRSEGLGLGLMEAMALGKPAVATGWSGNMSFMNHRNACPVRYTLIPAQGTLQVYQAGHLGAGAVWAEPDIIEAAGWMRALAEDPSLRTKIGTRAAMDIQAYHRDAVHCNFVEQLRACRGHRQLLRNYGVGKSLATAPTPNAQQPPARDDAYLNWLNGHSLREVDAEVLAERMVLKWRQRPSFHWVLVMTRGQEHLLADAVDSLGGQMYHAWRLSVIADFPSPDPAFDALPVLEWLQVGERDSVAATANETVAAGGCDWVALTRAGLSLEPQTLLMLADYINVRPAWRVIYTDEDVVGEDGVRCDPKFKPDFNLDWLRSAPYVGELVFFHRESLSSLGGFAERPGAYGYDGALRVLDAFGEQALGHVSEVLFHTRGGIEWTASPDVRRAAVLAHLARRALDADVAEGAVPGTQRIIYHWPQRPKVTVIIPNKDQLDYLRACLESLLERTAYPNYEVIVVDNGSSDPAALAYYDGLLAREPRLRVIPYPHAFNFSAMNNLAAREATGEYLLLLNNDTQIVQDDWLERMMMHGQRPEVGVVGARLVYPTTCKLQHAGVILGLHGVADHVFNGQLDIKDAGYMNRAQVDQNYSAVTAACLLIRRSVYDEVGGLDEERFKVSYNDVDLCLKVRELGYKLVWTPHATAVHHGSASQKKDGRDAARHAANVQRFKEEQAAMIKKWLPHLAADPAYNPHLSLRYADCRVDDGAVVNWDRNFHDRPRILGIAAPGSSDGAGLAAPFGALSRAGLAHCNVLQAGPARRARVPTPVEIERAKPDTLVLQAPLDDEQWEALARCEAFNGEVLRVLTLDDTVTQAPAAGLSPQRFLEALQEGLHKALARCDRAVAATEPLADMCRASIEDVRLIPPRLERALWGNLAPRREHGGRPRVGWTGGPRDAGELALIADVVKATAKEIDWILFGPCPDGLRPFVREVHAHEPCAQTYPTRLANLNLDVAVAPLEIHPLNEARSNLRLLEHGILGYPVVCTDIRPYHGSPAKRVPNDARAWIEAIRERAHDPDAARSEGRQLRDWVLQRLMLEDHLEPWLHALLR